MNWISFLVYIIFFVLKDTLIKHYVLKSLAGTIHFKIMRNKHCLKKNQKYLRLFPDCRSFPSVVCIVCRLGHQLMEWNHRNRKPFGRKACFKISSDSVVGFLYLAFCGLPTYIHLKDKMNTLNVMGRSITVL